jgi:anti-sigma-K factor RskA
MSPEEREALLASFALGTLSAPDAADAERLIRSDPSAAAEVKRYEEIAELIALAAPLHRPDPHLRERVLAAARRDPAVRRPRRLHIPVTRLLPAAAMAAALAVVSVWAVNLQAELKDLRDETALLTAVVESDAKRLDQLAVERDSQGDISIKLQTALQEQQLITSIVADPEARSFELEPTESAHGATGSYAWSNAADSAVVIVRSLQPIGFGSTYRITLADRWGNPLAAKSFTPDEFGDAQVVIATPAGSWPQAVYVFATNEDSDSKTPDGPVVLESVSINP